MTRGQFKIYRCAVAGVHAVEASTDHSFPRRSHDQYGVGLIYKGAQKSFSGRGMVEAGPGNMITVNPGEVHDGMPIGDGGRTWRMLYFDPAIIVDIANDISEDSAEDYEFTLPVMADSGITPLFRTLFAAMTIHEENLEAMKCEELLLRMLSQIAHTRQRNRPVGPASISRVQALIDDMPAATVSLADLARASRLSRFQVLRGFVKATGFTPHAYLMQKRIDLARRLIIRGTGLAEAAAASGFADQSHMTRLFARKYGVSPGTYAAAFT